jgi:hypothetical protein
VGPRDASPAAARHDPKEACMALLMKSECERCDRPLPLHSPDARICSYECTFCADCATALGARCPNCGGELKARPRREHRLEVPAEGPVPGE